VQRVLVLVAVQLVQYLYCLLHLEAVNDKVVNMADRNWGITEDV
jgi:heme/copper-type cytochrome/quinol oxidase subunit 4